MSRPEPPGTERSDCLRSTRKSKLTPHDLAGEALAGVLQRPARSLLTALGTVLGVGSFICVLGLTGTAASQIDARFNKLSATEVTVADTGGGDADRVPIAFPENADERVQGLHGVTAAGMYWQVRLGAGQTAKSTPSRVSESDDARTPVVAASPGLLNAMGPRLAQGRTFDAYHDLHQQRVAVIGSGLSHRLGITTLDAQPAVFIGDVPFTVIGIVDDVERKPDLLLSVLIPHSTARSLWGPPGDDRAHMLISTNLGAAPQVADEVPLALRPDHPEYFKSTPPPDPKALRSDVGGDLNQLFLLLAGICLVIGAVGIANTTLVAVMERAGEIGLRRALGARGKHIMLQFLAESAALGLFGGLIGTSLGAVSIVIVSVVRHWTPVISPTMVAAAPALGLVTGVLAGLYPAWRAARIPPAEALRR
ncbi:ABC transporter permease [Streptomyces sp. NPDC052396]|uniref:ABC transporter permease n=1 Tax=Streptomyces sp. NPDC052396 TaxID=3365689 RepID=UPI0037D09BA0